MKKIMLEIEDFQLTIVITLIAFVLAISFVAGYFWGKKSALQDFSEQIKIESFADKVYASLYALKDNDSDAKEGIEKIEEDDGVAASENENHKMFSANLISYGTRAQAEDYVNRLKKRGLGASILQRSALSSKGKKRIWYQVVSDPAPYSDTKMVVKLLSAQDRLAGATIVEAAIGEAGDLE